MWIWITLIVTTFIVVYIFSRLKKSANSINDYFCDAALLYSFTGCELGRSAALAAAKTAARDQRSSMADYLIGLASDMKHLDEVQSKDSCVRLISLHEEIIIKDWSVAESSLAKQQLGNLDIEALKALNKSNGNYFRENFPDVYEVD